MERSGGRLAGFSGLDYKFKSGADAMVQRQASVGLDTRILNNLFLNLYYQGIFSASTTYGSILGGFSYRF